LDADSAHGFDLLQVAQTLARCSVFKGQVHFLVLLSVLSTSQKRPL